MARIQGTSAIYNNIHMNNVVTEQITQKSVMDASGVSVLYYETTVRLFCYVQIGSSDQPSGGVTQQLQLGIYVFPDLQSQLNNLIQTLTVPKRRFQYFVNGTTVFDVNPDAEGLPNNIAAMDVNNGPKTDVLAYHIANGNSCKIHFQVRFALAVCGVDTNHEAPGPVINFDWWQTDSIDENWHTTRVWEGHLRTNTKQFGVHGLRGIAVPPLLKGFYRHSINLQESKDGYSLNFRIVDKERWAHPPLPGLTWTGSHSLNFPKPGLNYAESEMLINLKGRRDVDKQKLAVVAYRLIDSKLHLNDIKNGGGDFPMAIRFTDHIHDSAISIFAKIMHTAPVESETGSGGQSSVKQKFGKLFKEFGTRMDGRWLGQGNVYNSTRFVTPIPTASLANLFIRRLHQDPCDIQSGFPPMGPTEVDYEEYEAEEDDEDRSYYDSNNGEELRDDGLTGLRRPGQYVHYNTNSDYQTVTGDAVMPLAFSPESDRSTVNVNLHQPISRRLVRIHASRINSPPDLPSAETFSDKSGNSLTPTFHRPIFAEPVLSADGQKVLYRAVCHVEYALNDNAASVEFPNGTPPYMQEDGHFVKNIITSEFIKNPGEYTFTPIV